MYGEKYIEKVGYPVTGDGKLDRERLSTVEVMRQTPAGLAMLHAQGAVVDFVNPRDTVDVYEDIQEHLRDWEAMVVAGCHIDDVPPIEEFRMLEDVAIAIHSIAKYFQPRETSRNLVRERIHAMNMRRSSVSSYITAKQKEEKAHEKPYVSIVDRIERRLQE
jgi:aspartate aminotransferase-like enzyme